MRCPKPFYPMLLMLLVGGLLFLLTLGAATRWCLQRSSSRSGEDDAPPPVETSNPQPARSAPVVRPMRPRPAAVAPPLEKSPVLPQVAADAEPSGDPSLTDDERKLLEFKRDVARRNKLKLLQRRAEAGSPENAAVMTGAEASR